VVHPRGSLLLAAAAMDLLLIISVADLIVCGARVVIDAGGEGKREYLDAGGRLLAAWRIERKGSYGNRALFRPREKKLQGCLDL
jgi:hypothetical protein